MNHFYEFLSCTSYSYLFNSYSYILKHCICDPFICGTNILLLLTFMRTHIRIHAKNALVHSSTQWYSLLRILMSNYYVLMFCFYKFGSLLLLSPYIFYVDTYSFYFVFVMAGAVICATCLRFHRFKCNHYTYILIYSMR